MVELLSLDAMSTGPGPASDDDDCNTIHSGTTHFQSSECDEEDNSSEENNSSEANSDEEENTEPTDIMTKKDSPSQTSKRKSRDANLPSINHLRALACKGRSEFGAKSTKDNYDSIVKEYEQFAQEIYNNKSITAPKVFDFLSYQAHRPLRTAWGEFVDESGKKKKKIRRHGFDLSDFTKVMDDLKNRSVTDPELPKSNRLQTLEKHWSALLLKAPDKEKSKLRDHQGISDLRYYVEARKKTADRVSCKDKSNPQIEKFEYVKLSQLCEEYFWNKHIKSGSLRDIGSSFRNRYELLTTLQTLVRHESVIKCKLSDFQFIEYHAKDEVDPYRIVFRNITVAKNQRNDANSGKRTILQAKSLRHKNPELCEQGALAFYLLCRSLVNEEMFDFSDNNNWYHIHTSVAIGTGRSNPKKAMAGSTYSKELKLAFAFHKYKPSHIKHFGRSAGPILLEFEEVLPAYIKELGNWLLGVFEAHYSAKMAWEALRVAAGFRKEKGFNYTPRSHIKPPDALKRLVFPNIEMSRRTYEDLSDEEQMDRKGAKNFLATMDYLAEVVLQDAAYYILFAKENRSHHSFFSLVPLFREPLFQEYLNKFNQEYPVLCHPDNDPTFDKLKKSVPEIGYHLGSIHAHTASQTKAMSNLREDIQTGFQNLSHQVWDQNRQLYEAIENGLSAALNAFHQQRQTDDSAPLEHSPRRYLCFPTQQTRADDKPDGEVPATPSRAGGPTASPFNQSPVIPKSPVVPKNHSVQPPTPSSAHYTSLKTIRDDWIGSPDSPFSAVGGLQSLDKDQEYRKTLSQETKKVFQRISFINRFIQHKAMSDSLTTEEVFTVIEDAFKHTKKTEITLSGTAEVLRKKLGWNGKSCSQ